MNRTVLVLAIVATSALSGLAQITNNPSGVDPFILNDLSFSGGSEEIAATVTGINSFQSANTSYQGGQGGVTSGDESQQASGAAAISIDNVGTSVLSGPAVAGGNGGSASVTSGSATLTATAEGGSGILFLPASASQQLTIENGVVSGGNGGAVDGAAAVKLYGNGGHAVNLESGGSLNLSNSELSGGVGGTANSGSGFTTARGGRGISVYTAYNLGTIADGTSIAGGKGGTVTNPSEGAQVMGGDGVFIMSTASQTLSFTGGALSGGAGGRATYNTDVVSDPSSEKNYFGEAYGEVESFSGARGGNAFRYFSDDYVQYGVTLNIDGGTFQGGAGGVSVNSGVGDSIADGGHGIFTDYADINITDGVFRGGAAGVSNGVAAADGVGVFMRDGNLTVSGGTFDGLGLMFESHYYDSSAAISGGTFGDVVFTATYDEFYFVPDRKSTVTISDGEFGNVLVNGTALNDLTISGGTFESLEFGGSSTNTAELTGATIGKITLTGGMTDVNAWDDAVFADTTVSQGTLNFNNQAFNMESGSSFILADENAAVNFGSDALISGTLDVNKGAMTVASHLTVKGGSDLSTTIYAEGTGVAGGMISAETATFEDDVTWTLVNDGTVTNADSLSDGVLLVSADVADGITHSFDGLDMQLIGNPSVLLGINGVTNTFNAGKQELYATYGQLSLEKVFEDYPEMGPAMADLQLVLDDNPELTDYIASEWSDYDSLAADFSQSFIRTPEVTSVLMGLQGVFADQIKDRTRSNLRYKKFGSKTSSTPSGAQGPGWSGNSASPSGARGPDWYENSVQWTHDQLPSWNEEAVRTASDNAPMLDADAVADSVNAVIPKSSGEGIELPETYQVWGRAYGSRLDQDATTTGHMGYDATIVGGVLGVDKRFEKMLIGLAAGYAHTDLNGNGGNDGDADTAYAMGYFSHSSDSLFFDATLNYAFNDVETKGASSVGYEGEYDASTVGFGIGTGYGMSFYKDQLLFTPEASYLGTYYNRGSYTEKSNLATPFPDKDYESYDQWSHLTSIGATLSTIGMLDYFNAEIEYQPELRAHWLHEFNAEMDNDSYMMVGGSGDPLAVALQAREEDLIRLGAGIRFSKWQSDATEFGLDIDGAFGGDYQNFIVSGKIMHRF